MALMCKLCYHVDVLYVKQWLQVLFLMYLCQYDAGEIYCTYIINVHDVLL